MLLCGGGVQAQTNHGISAALLNIVQNDTSNNVESVTVTATVSVNQFSVRPGSNRADFFTQIGEGFSDDFDTGVMIACVAENGRDNGETNYPGLNYCTVTVDSPTSGGNEGGYYVSTFNSPAGAEYNINVAAAFFPYDKWLGGLARNSGATNGGANNSFTGSPGLVLGTHFIDNGGGQSIVNLTNFGIDSRTSGVLLVTHGKNEDNVALSSVNTNNGTWTVYIKDNGTDAGSYEQDPVAFVYVPKTNTTVVSGRFRGDGTVLLYSGASPQFNVTNTAAGTWRLTIPGQSPASGVLVISAEGGLSQNQDNIVSYQPDGDGWIIQSRDMPGNPPTLQTPGSGLEPAASFVFVPAGATVTLLSPVNNTANVASSVTLQAAVSNSTPSNVTVNFYGRPAAVNPANDFEVIALPDTQFYVSSLNGGLPAMFTSQTEWIITNRISRNIAYVAQLGDVSQNGDIKGSAANTTEWQNATNALYRLENPTRTLLAQGIPYGVAQGNHDWEPIGDSTGTSIFFNQYFGVSHFAGKNYYAGHYGTTNNNHFDFFSAGGMDFIVLYFAYDDTLNPNILAWGNSVLQTNHNRRAIIVTHNFGGTTTPLNFSAQGSAIYNTVKYHTNVFMMLAGHVTGQGTRVDTFGGNTIRTFVSDYQGWTNGGNGYLRIISFSPANNVVTFQTYSPYVDDYDTSQNSEIFFNYNMQTPGGSSSNVPVALVATRTNVAPGAVTSCVWAGLQSFASYEWYATVTDALGNTSTSSTWKFSTAPNTPPVVTNRTISVYGDAATNIVLIASDINGDALTFSTNTWPTHGLLQNLVPSAGVVTYTPTRGYRGFDKFVFSASDAISTSGSATLNMNVISPPDGNGNGLPDAWESSYGVTDPDGDDDHDGESNLQEYQAGTNPTNAASVFRILGTTSSTNGFRTFSWSTIGGTRYRVQYGNGSDNGGVPASFFDVTRSLSVETDPGAQGSPSSMSFTDDYTLTGGAPTNSSRYYRVRVTQ